jgi:hypothetical protein
VSYLFSKHRYCSDCDLLPPPDATTASSREKNQTEGTEGEDEDDHAALQRLDQLGSTQSPRNSSTHRDIPSAKPTVTLREPSPDVHQDNRDDYDVADLLGIFNGEEDTVVKTEPISRTGRTRSTSPQRNMAEGLVNGRSPVERPAAPLDSRDRVDLKTEKLGMSCLQPTYSSSTRNIDFFFV